MNDKILDIISKHTIGVPRAKTLEDLADLENNTVKELETLFSLHDVSQCNELLKAKKEPILKELRDNLTKANEEYADGKMTDAVWLRHTGFLKGKISALLNFSL